MFSLLPTATPSGRLINFAKIVLNYVYNINLYSKTTKEFDSKLLRE